MNSDNSNLQGKLKKGSSHLAVINKGPKLNEEHFSFHTVYIFDQILSKRSRVKMEH